MEKKASKRRISPKKIVPVILGLVLIGGIIFGIREYIYYQNYVTTDDAQIDGDISPVVTRVGGYVTQIRFQDNQRVNAGDTLVVLDDHDYKIRLEQAQAALKSTNQNIDVTKSNVTATAANIATAKANVDAAQVKVWKATQDFNRYQNLYNEQAITKSQFDGIQAEKESAAAGLTAAQSQYAAVTKQVSTSKEQVGEATSNLALRVADIDFAKLQLSYTVITAPVSGIVSKRNIQPGQLVQPGQTMFAIVNDSSIYVTANFKETQLENLKPGQKTDIEVDAYPNHQFEGIVDNFSGATGAKFSLLPPDNATGNFVKVVQRVPVKILFTGVNKQWMEKLRPGLSVNVSVHVKK